MKTTMALAGTALAILATGSPALAQARPDSLAMTCASVQSLVRTRGALIVGTGPYVFDRFVVDRRFCAVTEGTEAAWVQTRDAKACSIGFRCKPLVDTWPWSDL